MMIFIHSGNKIRIYKVSSGNKLECIASFMTASLFNIKTNFTSYSIVMSTSIYNGLPKSQKTMF